MDSLEAVVARFPQECSIVGIGASAGGLEACSALLKHLPAVTGLSFVVIQHLDPNHESILPALLARVTSIPVLAVQSEMSIEPNQVYVMPPGSEILLSGGILRLIPREKTAAGTFMPIDGFFRSLAEDCRHRAIGVVLSGTGSDGALGLEMIKAEGGFTFAQDTQSARFEGMPSSAFATGSVDFVLPPEGIAQELTRIAKLPYAERVDNVARQGEIPQDRASVQGILQFLHAAAGIDFSQYRASTVQRRIYRRMAIQHMVDPESYRKLLTETPGEVEILCEDMIPKVTRFFRDPEVFTALQQKVFPQLLLNRSHRTPIRVWVPGCASGEEVFAIAICLLEFLKENSSYFPIQIFGTDLSGMAIQKARKGFYPEKISEDVSAERLRQFFLKREGGYQVSAALRETCIFANHDLINDPPYSKLDLISCRNVLIYLDSVQTRILPLFHYALKPAGFLMLGLMETARRFSDLFEPVDRAAQIYIRKAAAGRPSHNWSSVKAAPAIAERLTGDVWEDADLQKRADRAVLANYAPGGVLVNENWQVLQVRGQVAPYLEPASGKMSVNVIHMAERSGLALDLAAALDQARSENAPARRENLRVRHEKVRVNLQVMPLGSQGEDSRLFLVLFEPRSSTHLAPPHDHTLESAVSPTEFLKMQREMAGLRERLATVLDRHQQYSDETQSAQEESLSNLEEIQSFNEELETAKEELQSTNEELTSVNDELETRNSDLQHARDFATSIVETVQHPLIVLDNSLRLRKANRAFYQLFRLSESQTTSRVIYDLADGAWNVPDLRAHVEKVLNENRPFDAFELDGAFPQVGRRILSISARRLDRGELILMSLEDITERKRAELELRATQDELRQGQKMEAIGRLAGGVAHDFNNLLTGVLGFSEILMRSLDKDSEAFRQASEIMKAGERAASLTHQLLAFSRRQVLHPQVLSLNTMVLEMNQMLRRLIGDNITLDKSLEPDSWPVHADPGQMSQVILNLALNARDAMPDGGVLTIRTTNTLVEPDGKPTRDLAPGGYATLSVSDSGTGMDAVTQQHIFEPFYTTKPQGSGTGLGLATVVGIVKQSGGFIQFESEVNCGTTFWVDLPRVAAAPVGSASRDWTEMPTGDETVLVVEDEDVVRGLSVLILKRQGYTVLEAREAGECIDICRSYPDPIHLLLTDVLMPGGRNGRELAEQAILIRPGLRVLLMSGYTTDALIHYGVGKGEAFLQKPFTLQKLAHAVRDVLDKGTASHALAAAGDS